MEERNLQIEDLVAGHGVPSDEALEIEELAVSVAKKCPYKLERMVLDADKD